MKIFQTRSQKAANIQTEHVVYNSEEVQTVETKSIEVTYIFEFICEIHWKIF